MYAARFDTASAQGLPVRNRLAVNIYFSELHERSGANYFD